MSDYLGEVFGPGGYLAQHFEVATKQPYEPRSGQVALARLVDRAMREHRHVLGEGPCGTGKSVAYCVPAAWHARPIERVRAASGARAPLTACLVCGRHLSDVLSMKIGIGPVCRREYDLDDAPAEAVAALEKFVAAGGVSEVCDRLRGLNLGLLAALIERRFAGRVAAGKVMAPGKRTVIVTANIGLQEQLITKDLPDLAKILPWRFTFALLKGRGNYYCKDHAQAASRVGFFDDLRRGSFRGDDAAEASEQLEALLDWVEHTKTGDKSDLRDKAGLPFIPAESLWSRVSVQDDDCKRRDCDYFKECYFYEAKRRAHVSDIIVTNYHVLFAHLVVRDLTGQDIVLPEYDHLILDEAHEAADIAREFFGFTVGEGAVKHLAKYVRGHIGDELASVMLSEAERFFKAVAAYEQSGAYSIRLKTPGFVSEPVELLGALEAVARYAAQVAEADEDDDKTSKQNRADARNACRRASSIIERIQETVSLEDANKVYYIDRTSRGAARLGAKLIDVSESLRAWMFDGTLSITLTSATLTTEGNFSFVRRELGVPEDALELAAETPFDFQRQALLIVPPTMPRWDADEFSDAVAAVIRDVVAECSGRTLCLFTSNKNMHAVYDLVNEKVPYQVLKQGQMPRNELSRIFKEKTDSVLFGVNSFWTGIDVPGDALTGLVIDKLPFPNSSDPVVDAIRERDKDWFVNLFKPRAIIMLRQGVGRLIRNQKDIGAVVILDPRLTDKGKGYRWDFFKSLPNMRRSSEISDIGRFLRGEALVVRALPTMSAEDTNIRSLFDR